MSATASPGRPVRIALFGATGRMGQSLLRAIHESTDFELVGALASPESPALGQDAAEPLGLARRFGVAITADRRVALERAEVVLDFTLPGATLSNIDAATAAGAPLLIGTTALGPEVAAAVEVAARRIAVLVAPNTSLGVNLLALLIERAARALPPEYDIEILDVHHRYKVDAPSGTALRLGDAAAAGRSSDLKSLAVEHASARPGARQAGSIGFAALRGGDIAGEHSVFFLGPGERLELTHRAHDRMTFAYGALRAAGWLRGRAPGRHSMTDVLGL